MFAANAAVAAAAFVVDVADSAKQDLGVQQLEPSDFDVLAEADTPRRRQGSARRYSAEKTSQLNP